MTMYLISVLSFSCVILSVTCAPQRYWASEDVHESPRPYWLNSRRSAYPPLSIYGSIGDDMTRMLAELERSLLTVRADAGPQIPVFDISTSTSDEYDNSDEGTGPSVSISGTGFGTLFRNFGGFDAKNLKNKTTVKTEVIDGHKVTVKESTYVSDQDGIKSVIHLSEVDLADSTESDEKTKPSTPKTDEDESPEDKDEKEDADKEEDDKKSEEKPKEDSTPKASEDQDKTESQSPEVEVEISKPTEEPASKNDEEKDTDKNSEENHVKTNRHPDMDVEEIDTDGDNYYNYKYNTIGKVKEDDEATLSLFLGVDWSDNEIDAPMSRDRRAASTVINHPALPKKNCWNPLEYIKVRNSQTRHRRNAGRHNLQGDTRVNQILSEKQKSSGLYSIDPDAELLGDNNYEVEGRRPSTQQVVFYKQRPAQYVEEIRRPQNQQRIPNYQQFQQAQARPPRYNSGEYQRSLPVTDDYQGALLASDDYQRNIPVQSEQYQVTDSPYNSQRSLPFSSTVYNEDQQKPVNGQYSRNYGPNEIANFGPIRGDLINPEPDDYQRTLPVAAEVFPAGNKLPVDYQRPQVIQG